MFIKVTGLVWETTGSADGGWMPSEMLIDTDDIPKGVSVSDYIRNYTEEYTERVTWFDENGEERWDPEDPIYERHICYPKTFSSFSEIPMLKYDVMSKVDEDVTPEKTIIDEDVDAFLERLGVGVANVVMHYALRLINFLHQCFFSRIMNSTKDQSISFDMLCMLRKNRLRFGLDSDPTCVYFCFDINEKIIEKKGKGRAVKADLIKQVREISNKYKLKVDVPTLRICEPNSKTIEALARNGFWNRTVDAFLERLGVGVANVVMHYALRLINFLNQWIFSRIMSSTKDQSISSDMLCMLPKNGYGSDSDPTCVYFCFDIDEKIIEEKGNDREVKADLIKQVREISNKYKLKVTTFLNVSGYQASLYWSTEDDAYIVEVPAFHIYSASGKTIIEALDNAETAINKWVETAKLVGWEIPQPKGRLM